MRKRPKRHCGRFGTWGHTNRSLSSSKALWIESTESKMSKSSEDFSKTFYPFLHEGEELDEGPEGQDAFMEELGHSIVAKARESAEVKTRFFEENLETILQASLAMARAFHRGRKLLVC